MPINTVKSLLRNVLLLLSSIIFFLVVAELGKRTYDKIFHGRDFFHYVYDSFRRVDTADVFVRTEKGKRYKPNNSFVATREWRSDKETNITINSLGFRDNELGTKKENEFRIFIMGDSITAAVYLEKENIYVEQLEKQLNNTSQEIQFQVINGGMEDMGLAEEVDILRENGLKTQPDLVGIGFYLNDSRAPWAFHVERDIFYNISRKSRFLGWVWRQIYFEKYIREVGKDRFRWVKTFKQRKWVHSREIFYEMVNNADSDWGSAWLDDSWEIIERKLDEVLNLGKKHNFKVFLFCFPVRVQVESEIFDNNPQQIIKKICREKNILFLDLLPILLDNKEKDLFYDQCHLKPIGNKIVAGALFKFLKDQNLVQRITQQRQQEG